MLCILLLEMLQHATVAAGEVFTYTVSQASMMADNTGATIEDKAQIIMASDDIIVYASNKQVQYLYEYKFN